MERIERLAGVSVLTAESIDSWELMRLKTWCLLQFSAATITTARVRCCECWNLRGSRDRRVDIDLVRSTVPAIWLVSMQDDTRERHFVDNIDSWVSWHHHKTKSNQPLTKLPP
jgi:hypothetical protein